MLQIKGYEIRLGRHKVVSDKILINPLMRHNSLSVIKPKKEPLGLIYLVRNYQVHFSGRGMKKGASQWGIRYPEKARGRRKFLAMATKKKTVASSGCQKKR